MVRGSILIYTQQSMMADSIERDQLVIIYFQMGLCNKEILQSLAHGHGIIISIRTLKRITKKCALYRRKNASSIADVALYIRQLCNGAGFMHGYRWLHQHCINRGFVVSQNTVCLLLGVLDPDGVALRKRRRLRRRAYDNPGPNMVWHVDGYDKLAPYPIWYIYTGAWMDFLVI